MCHWPAIYECRQLTKFPESPQQFCRGHKTAESISVGYSTITKSVWKLLLWKLIGLPFICPPPRETPLFLNFPRSPHLPVLSSLPCETPLKLHHVDGTSTTSLQLGKLCSLCSLLRLNPGLPASSMPSISQLAAFQDTSISRCFKCHLQPKGLISYTSSIFCTARFYSRNPWGALPLRSGPKAILRGPARAWPGWMIWFGSSLA